MKTRRGFGDPWATPIIVADCGSPPSQASMPIHPNDLPKLILPLSDNSARKICNKYNILPDKLYTTVWGFRQSSIYLKKEGPVIADNGHFSLYKTAF